MRLRSIVIVAVIVVGLGVAVWAVSLYSDWLWFDNLGYGSVFLTVFFTQWGVRLAAWGLLFVFLFVNLYRTRDALMSLSMRETGDPGAVNLLAKLVTTPRITAFLLIASLLISFLLSSYTGTYWLQVSQFFHGQEFNISEPIFGRDASYYVFELPFWRFLYSFLQTAVIFTLVLVGIVYVMVNPPVQVGRRIVFLPYRGQGHVSLLMAFAFLLKAWDYRLQMFELMFSPRGFTYGPGYTDMNAQLPALWILLSLSLGITAMLIFNIYRRQGRLIFLSVVLLIAGSVAVGNIYPAVIQRFRVDPNEFAFERPFIEHNIALTLKAFALDDVQLEHYPARQQLDWDGLEAASGTLDNVRLWDYRPLLQTYNQLQGIRPYYVFHDVDTDRYYINGEYRQVMLSARELDQGRFPEEAQTWVNQRLQFTHGYGLAMSPVATVTPQGLPDFNVRDIPPVSTGELEINRPEIYYGEISNNYVIANSRTAEFNYPMGERNVYTHYEGSGGVPLKGLFRRIVYAYRFYDYNILLSGEITGESRIMFNRRIRERAAEIAPFLRYDTDPYLVLAGGRLFWIIDAYSVTNRFPYSEPYGGANYMRNSVKVVIDTYNGNVDYYIVEPDDALVQTYAHIFPDLFKTMEEMPEKLHGHLRYPETYFSLQANVYSTYHMGDPVAFYNREGLWQIPNERYRGNVQPVEPYYNILQLPGEEEPEFVLMQPFAPSRRDNMIAWMAGRSDEENYGQLLVYHFPKERMVYGPMQVETRIDQNPLISQQLALWDQRGSRVIRGNLLVLPVNESLLYVEPVFLQADDSELPELARVIVGFHETVVMEPTLEEALVSIFGPREDREVDIDEPEERPADPDHPDYPDYPDEVPAVPATMQELALRAQELYLQAQESLRQGDWENYGRALQQLEETLQELVETADVH